MRDPYKALGVTTKSSDAEIKKAYRNLAKKYHPDRNAGDKAKEERFKDISAAYQILSDPAKRSRFDHAASGGGIPMEGNLSDIFAQMFGGAQGRGGRGQRPQSGFGGGSPFGGMGGGSPFGGSPFGGMGGQSPFGGGGSPFGGQARAPQRPAKKSPPKERQVKADAAAGNNDQKKKADNKPGIAVGIHGMKNPVTDADCMYSAEKPTDKK